ncbi:hypothetical protein ACFE04_014605 [Oxalis oulophora]
MDPNFNDYANGFTLDDLETLFSNSDYDDDVNLTNDKFNLHSPDLNFLDIPHLDIVEPNINEASFVQSSSWSPETGDSHSPDDSESSDPVLKYISKMLMEENMEAKPCMFHDPLSLRDTERSLYDVIGEQQPHYSADSIFSGNSNDSGVSSTSTSSGIGSFLDSLLVDDTEKDTSSLLQTSVTSNHQFENSFQPDNENQRHDLTNPGDGLMGSVNEFLAQNMFRERESVLQYKRGLEEASKFLPTGNQLIIGSESRGFVTWPKVETLEASEKENSSDWSRSRKNHEREAPEVEEVQRQKQVALNVEESEISEMFDKVLLLNKCTVEECVKQTDALQQITESNGPKTAKSRGKGQGKKKETVDLRNLLILCAQAVSGDDRRTANELLKQIRQHSSVFGDGSQRLAHFFANGLEARLAGSGPEIKSFYVSLFPKKSAIDMLKAYKEYLRACPFKKLSIFFANKMILNLAAKNAKTLHIIDFGISYGFQWPVLIQHFGALPGGPHKLRITGIEFPQPGFRPAERIEETGRRLAKYCDRFNVLFEFNAIASQHWETIKIEEINIKSNELVAVNSLQRLKNLLDETVEVNCPRNAVLNLIRKMNPAIFINSVCNGAYNAPFFVTRFREAIFHYSALFDMLDATCARDNQERMMYEKEFCGREAMNVIACEGLERVERPETYKQWQVRFSRAGFKPLPVNQELLENLRGKLGKCYHKDFRRDNNDRCIRLRQEAGWDNFVNIRKGKFLEEEEGIYDVGRKTQDRAGGLMIDDLQPCNVDDTIRVACVL